MQSLTNFLNEENNKETDIYEGLQPTRIVELTKFGFSGSLSKGYWLSFGDYKFNAYLQSGLPLIEISYRDNGFLVDGEEEVGTIVDGLSQFIELLKNGTPKNSVFIQMKAAFKNLITDKW